MPSVNQIVWLALGSAMPKNVLFINRAAPHGTSFSQEKLQMAMVFGAFELNVSMLFLDNGVYSLMKNQETKAIGFQNFAKQYQALEQYYDIREIYVDKYSLEKRMLKPDQLMIPVRLLDRSALKNLMHGQDFIINN